MTVTVHQGSVLPDLPHLGHLLPLETQVSLSPTRSELFLNPVPRTWTTPNHKSWVDFYAFSNPIYLRSDIEVQVPKETARQFRWRLRDSALGAAERAGVAIPPVRAMCTEFGASEPLLRVGGVVSSDTDMALLPNGTVLYLGHPDSPDLCSVWETSGGDRLTYLMGPHESRPRGMALTIHSIPGAETPVDTDAPLTEAEWAAIAVRAWRVGKTYKQRQSWCGVFENMLTSLGITEETVQAATGGVDAVTGVGETLTKQRVGHMPEGTLLWWPWRNGDGFAVYIRDDSARGIAKTRRLFGHGDDGSNTHPYMKVLQTPTEEMLWTVPGRWLRLLPDGVTHRRYGYDTVRVLDDERRSHIIDYVQYSVTGWPT